jgi:hypothetical protein
VPSEQRPPDIVALPSTECHLWLVARPLMKTPSQNKEHCCTYPHASKALVRQSRPWYLLLRSEFGTCGQSKLPTVVVLAVGAAITKGLLDMASTFCELRNKRIDTSQMEYLLLHVEEMSLEVDECVEIFDLSFACPVHTRSSPLHKLGLILPVVLPMKSHIFDKVILFYMLVHE